MSTSAAAVSTPAAAERGARPALLVGALGVVFGDIGTVSRITRGSWRRCGTGDGARHTIVGILGRRPGRGTQVRPVRDARRQSGRRGHDGIDLARAAGSGAAAQRAVDDRPWRRLAFFGDDDHSGDFGLERDRGSSDRDPGPQAVCRAGRRRGADRAVRDPKPGQRPDGSTVRALMATWFVVLGLAGIVHLAAKPEILVALNPRYALAYVAHADGWVGFTAGADMCRGTSKALHTPLCPPYTIQQDGFR